MRIRIFCGSNDFLSGRTRLAVTDIFINRTGKQIDILLYDSDVIAQTLECDFFDIVPVDINISTRRLIKTRDQRTKCSLAGTGGTDQRHICTRRNIQ